MSEGKSYSLVNLNLDALGPPVKTLIDNISSGTGWLFKPYGMRREAKAEVDAALIRAQGDIALTDLQRRGRHRLVEEEGKKQENIEKIIGQAASLLGEDSNPEPFEKDWIVNFFEKCRIVSDKEMQSVWSKVLAGEAEKPGSYSRRTINSLADIDKSEATLFTQLCGFEWSIGDDYCVFIYDYSQDIYKSKGITFDVLSQLVNIGLIQFNDIQNYLILTLPKNLDAFYFGQRVELEFPKDTGNTMKVGKILLTKIGKQLAPICGSQPVNGFKDYATDRWKSEGYLKK